MRLNKRVSLTFATAARYTNVSVQAEAKGLAKGILPLIRVTNWGQTRQCTMCCKSIRSVANVVKLCGRLRRHNIASGP